MTPEQELDEILRHIERFPASSPFGEDDTLAYAREYGRALVENHIHRVVLLMTIKRQATLEAMLVHFEQHGPGVYNAALIRIYARIHAVSFDEARLAAAETRWA